MQLLPPRWSHARLALLYGLVLPVTALALSFLVFPVMHAFPVNSWACGDRAVSVTKSDGTTWLKVGGLGVVFPACDDPSDLELRTDDRGLYWFTTEEDPSTVLAWFSAVGSGAYWPKATFAPRAIAPWRMRAEIEREARDWAEAHRANPTARSWSIAAADYDELEPLPGDVAKDEPGRVVPRRLAALVGAGG